MIVPGLVSVTFRQYSVDEVVGLVAETGLQAIHWGGDVHVPVGDHAAARWAATRCSQEGIEIEAYGSYYVAGRSDPGSFTDVLETAVALGAPRIRVWAGDAASADASQHYRTVVADDLRRCADTAAERGVAVVLEYHARTLTDELSSALRLFEQVDHEAVESYWQPTADPSVSASQHEVAALLPKLTGVHMFSWGSGGYTDRLALADHDTLWRTVLGQMNTEDSPRHALLEFVQDDAPQNFRRDAKTLLGWLSP